MEVAKLVTLSFRLFENTGIPALTSFARNDG